MVACGALGMLAADGIETALGSDTNILLAAGGNGVALGMLCAWACSRPPRCAPTPIRTSS